MESGQSRSRRGKEALARRWGECGRGSCVQKSLQVPTGEASPLLGAHQKNWNGCPHGYGTDVLAETFFAVAPKVAISQEPWWRPRGHPHAADRCAGAPRGYRRSALGHHTARLWQQRVARTLWFPSALTVASPVCTNIMSETKKWEQQKKQCSYLNEKAFCCLATLGIPEPLAGLGVLRGRRSAALRRASTRRLRSATPPGLPVVESRSAVERSAGLARHCVMGPRNATRRDTGHSQKATCSVIPVTGLAREGNPRAEAERSRRGRGWGEGGVDAGRRTSSGGHGVVLELGSVMRAEPHPEGTERHCR